MSIDYEGDRRRIIQRAGEDAALKAMMEHGKEAPKFEKTFDARAGSVSGRIDAPAGFPGYPAPDPLVRIAVALEQIVKLLTDASATTI